MRYLERPRNVLSAVLASISLVLPVARLASPQGAGASVSGIVTDDSGGRLPGVTIIVTNKLTGQSQVLVSGPEGNYRAVALQPAAYEITAELTGFSILRREITLTVGADVTLDLELRIAGVEESVTVVGEEPLVEVTKAQLSSVVVSEQVDTLPNLGRNFLDLAQLLPGSGPDNSQVQYFNPTKFGGAADQRNAFTTVVDGGSIDDAIWGSTTMNITQEAVQEFNVLRNQFDAEHGASLNSVVTVVTKSGTNEFAGSGFYYGRDRALNARNAFATEKPPFDQQRYGGSLGGPIMRNKTHFFGAYEFSNVDTSKVIALPPVNPFASEQNGTFSSGSQNHLVSAKANHVFNDANLLAIRYAYDNQSLQRTQNVSSDSNQLDEFSRSHSIVAEHTWTMSQNKVNALRFHFLKQNVGNTPYSSDILETRPSVTTGQNYISPQYFPRTKATFYDTFYINTPRHSFKLGGELSFEQSDFEAHFVERGYFYFTTDQPFDENDSSTWPFFFQIQSPGLREFDSSQIALFAQDDWQIHSRFRLNLGLRYDLDTNLRNNDFYTSLLDDPQFAGIDRFISRDRGNDYNNLQPRLGFTWDQGGDGTLVIRGGYGLYITRNRPWFQLTSEDVSLGGAVQIEDPDLLRHYPDVNAVLGGQDIEDFLASGGARSLFLISDDYTLPVSHNFTLGTGWQLNSSTSIDVDFVHDVGLQALGATDRNLPPSGPITDDNPRPVSNFSLARVMENYTKSWYTALETQLRTRIRGADNLRVSYTLSRSYRDGVSFYGVMRGTQRTPQERGYNDTDQRHNLTFAAAKTLGWGIQVSGIAKFISGGPLMVGAGFGRGAGIDLDGDFSTDGDRPRGLHTALGREDVEESLQIINDFRAEHGLPPISRELLELDAFISLDARLTKSVDLGEGRRLDLLIEGFNLTNHVNYQPFTISGVMISPDFLIRNSARDARQFQWGVRFYF
jgi:Carboxypeptidase regulatory-like domain/TonB dependent receptor